MTQEYQGTDVAYNGVLLHNVMTRQWEQEVVYDDSGTDVLFTRYKLSFEGTVHLQNMISSPTFVGTLKYVSLNPPFVPGNFQLYQPSSVAHLYREVSRLLSQPHGNLQVTMAGWPVLTVVTEPNTTTDWDVDNGPKPQSFSLDHISGGNLFRVRWGVDVAITQCRNYAGSVGNVSTEIVLNNRWSVDESMDANFFLTRTITGKIRFGKSFINHQNYKGLITYPLENGFRRQSIQFQVQPSGLEATYTVVDKQVHSSAPWPATRMSATHSETTGDGVNVFGECSVRLEGPPNADKRVMLARAIDVIDSRLHVLRGWNKDYMVESCAIVDYIGEENVVEARMRIRHIGRGPEYAGPRIVFGNITEGNFGKKLVLTDAINLGDNAPPGAETYNSVLSESPNLWGYHTERRDETRSAVSFIIAHYLKSPCAASATDKIIWAGVVPLDEAPEYEDTFLIEQPPDIGGQFDLPQSSDDRYNQAAREAIYTHCVMENRYSLAPSRVMFPLSQSLGNTADDKRDSAVAISFGAGLCKREITIDVERIGELPKIPEPLDQYTDGELRGYLLDHWINPHPPTLTPDGKQTIHRITAHYVYGLNRQPTADEKIAIGVMPFTNLERTDTEFAMADLYDDQLLPGTRPITGETA